MVGFYICFLELNFLQVSIASPVLQKSFICTIPLILLQGTEYYDGKATDILQMMGRAGRPQFDQHGKAVILVHEPKKSFYKKVKFEVVT